MTDPLITIPLSEYLALKRDATGIRTLTDYTRECLVEAMEVWRKSERSAYGREVRNDDRFSRYLTYVRRCYMRGTEPKEWADWAGETP